jgi:hypothetical protein
MRARAFPAINEREIEMLRLAAVATDLYRRMAANLPQDHLPGDADDVRLARDLAASLSALTST